MPKIIPVGPSTHHVGKSLWEIVGNLKNFGVGRLVKRNIYERYPEPTYFRILKVETLPPPTDTRDLRKVRAYTEKVFRGRKSEKIFEICHESWKPDYVLVPKSEEKTLIEKAEAAAKTVTKRSLPSTIPFPPLLQELIIQERIAKGLPSDEEPRMKVIIRQKDISGEDLMYHLAEDDETPSIDYKGGKGKPISPQMYDIPEFYREKLEQKT
uniref:28S ribosomal protein S34, mitochondrial n=1 Tax=Cuerna arida TaxID=1464854 RepID=A0A1B6EQ94_9HEMI